MQLFNDCPECGKSFTRSKRFCNCGWQINNTDVKQLCYDQCGFWIEDKRCERVGTIASHQYSDIWYCIHHWYEAMNTKRGEK